MTSVKEGNKGFKPLIKNFLKYFMISTLSVFVIFMIVEYVFYIPDVYPISVQTQAIDSNNGGVISQYHDVTIVFYEKKGNQYYVLGVGNENGFWFNMIPPIKNSLYVGIIPKGYFVDDYTTIKSNSDLKGCSWNDFMGDGNKYFMCQIDTNSVDLTIYKHYSFTAFLYGEKSK